MAAEIAVEQTDTEVVTGSENEQITSSDLIIGEQEIVSTPEISEQDNESASEGEEQVGEVLQEGGNELANTEPAQGMMEANYVPLETAQENEEAELYTFAEEDPQMGLMSAGSNETSVSEIEEPVTLEFYFPESNYYMFSDGEMTIKPFCNLSDAELSANGYDVVYTYQAWNENESVWSDLNAGSEYSISDSGITLYGERIIAAARNSTGNAYTEVVAKVISGEEIFATAVAYVDVHDWDISYPLFENQTMLLGEGDNIYYEYNSYIQNTEYPEGGYIITPITAVTVLEETPEAGFNSVIQISNDDYYWYYNAVGCGDAVLMVTYKDINGNDANTTFSVHVVPQSYSVQISSENNEFQTLPGKSVSLNAQGYVNTIENGNCLVGEEYTYEWFIGENDYADIAEIQADASGKNATVTFGALPNDVENVTFAVYCKMFDEEHTELESGCVEISIANTYYKLYPTEVKTSMFPGEEQEIVAEVRKYSVDSEESDGYELIDNVHFRWEYSSLEDFIITDSEGNLVGYNESYEYVDTEACYGTKCTFTIRRNNSYDAYITLIGEWTDEQGNPESCSSSYNIRLEQPEIRFDEEDYSQWYLYSDGEKTLKANVYNMSDEDIEAHGYDIKYLCSCQASMTQN